MTFLDKGSGLSKLKVIIFYYFNYVMSVLLLGIWKKSAQILFTWYGNHLLEEVDDTQLVLVLHVRNRVLVTNLI